MPGQPVEDLTLLFTDIVGSTELHLRAGDTAPRVVERHFALVESAVREAGGRPFKRVGDQVCAEFDAPAAAVHAAVRIHARLAEEPWSELAPGIERIDVRIAVHHGPTHRLGGELHGVTLTVVARLLRWAAGRQVVLSEPVARAAETALPAGVSIVKLGQVIPRGLVAIPIFGLQGRGLAKILPPADSALVIPEQSSDQRDLTAVKDALHAAVRDATPARLSASDLRRLAVARPKDLFDYRLSRLARWIGGGHELDRRFVRLRLLVEDGGAGASPVWRDTGTEHADLGAVLDQAPESALVVLGSPGAGKTTLLRRLELDIAVAGLRGDAGRLSFFVPLQGYRGDVEPQAWLLGRWSERHPDLPPLTDLLRQYDVVFLLDGLNEMPAADESEYRRLVDRWRAFLLDQSAFRPGARAIFTCRTLEYGAPLSSADHPVPQIVVQSMDDEAVRDFLRKHCPVQADAVWRSLSHSRAGDPIRVPYLLAMLAQQAAAEGAAATGTASLFTGFVREAIRREVERRNPRFDPGNALSRADYRRVLNPDAWPGPYDLPDDGPLEPALRRLAMGMRVGDEGQSGQLRVKTARAVELLAAAHPDTLLGAALDLGVLEEDLADGEVYFVHQFMQDYFLAREVARRPQPERAGQPWRADEVEPALDELAERLSPADPLPLLRASPWEEALVLAAEMAPDAGDYVRSLMAENLRLAGRAAAEADVLSRLPTELVQLLAERLVARSRDPDADLRERLAAGSVLGRLGDPRFERGTGPDGPCLIPPFVTIAGGDYRIGSDEGIYPDEEAPEHPVRIQPFRLARFPVRNAEWAMFMAANGYDDPRWWPDGSGGSLDLGAVLAEASRWNARLVRRQHQEDPDLLKRELQRGDFSQERHDEIAERVRMSDAEFEQLIAKLFPAKAVREPRHWNDEGFNDPAAPVVGISWYEARAYCLWLRAQTGVPVRLPTEAEWEAAARGEEGRRFAGTQDLQPWCANTWLAHLRRTSPIGAFPTGDTPTGLVDMTGNVFEWTSSLYRDGAGSRRFDYPYDAADGREAVDLSPLALRISRGGGWFSAPQDARCAVRYWNPPGARYEVIGLRLAADC